MTATLQIKRIAPGATVQDLGRPGFVAQGLSQGGAMDRRALYEAAALLSLPAPVAALELAGAGGEFTVTQPVRFALTGAPMRAAIDGAEIVWNASHRLEPGQALTISGLLAGSFGYLTFAGGIETPLWQGSRSVHLSAGVGSFLSSGQKLPVGNDPAFSEPSQFLPLEDRFKGGAIGILPGPQTGLFPKETRQGFARNAYRRSPMANRQGVRLEGRALPIPDAAQGLVSDFILSGDIQITGDGLPVVLMAECQTVGGYPRIGTVVPSDLPKLAQAPAGAELRFQWVEVNQDPETGWLAKYRKEVQPLVRDPRDMRDLLRYDLIDGMIAGDEPEGG
ncbi:5-oxoprolinase subunit C family protein [Actibacterium pelagium]|uniref:Allophanate hydrolase n=1 Tax=Actibacterium pelagium TaxID=2029103 RepID=A0A917AB86_9RHOB|nr:biotin-dependent carboxyltransferase family protein [Actibacterium pelagium]GGE37862.1 allophanate hydrolase [Actibacterium pelagium]